MDVTLRPWDDAPENLELLFRMNTAAMTAHLGGPESADEIHARHRRYLAHPADGTSRMYRIDVDDEAAGNIGYWPTDEGGIPAFETGWGVVPEFQGRGVARDALRQLIALARADGRRALLVAYPGEDNAPSNALCRGAGFRPGRLHTEPWRGAELTFRVWTLAL